VTAAVQIVKAVTLVLEKIMMFLMEELPMGNAEPISPKLMLGLHI
jgi:hypothetical protein